METVTIPASTLFEMWSFREFVEWVMTEEMTIEDLWTLYLMLYEDKMFFHAFVVINVIQVRERSELV